MSLFGTDAKAPHPLDDMERQLALVPVRNSHVEIEKDDDDSMTVSVALKYSGMAAIGAKVLRLRRRKNFVLNGIGLHIFRQLDGRTTVENLIDGLMSTHALTFFESRALIVQYLQTLTANGLIAVGVPASGD